MGGAKCKRERVGTGWGVGVGVGVGVEVGVLGGHVVDGEGVVGRSGEVEGD